MPLIDVAGRYSADDHASYVEHLRTADISLGTYSIPTGATDGQSPHTEDEVYVVTAGRATFVDAAGAVPVGPGATLFVPAHAEHRFVDVTEDFAAVVVFGPAEGSRQPTS